MLTARERLAAWIERSKINQREAARLLGMDHTVLNQILKGRRGAGLSSAMRIERATGIPAEAWMPTDDGETGELVGVGARKSRVGKR
jgi:transcriptional regulator with XRE-family HTH domain